MKAIVSPLSAGVMELPLPGARIPVGIVTIIIHLLMGAFATHRLMLRTVAPAPRISVHALIALLDGVSGQATNLRHVDCFDRDAGGHNVRHALRNKGPSGAEETDRQRKSEKMA